MSGVLQGCPLSGLLFAVSLDPYLRWMKHDIEDAGLGVIRACADDIGASLCGGILPSAFSFRSFRLLVSLRASPSNPRSASSFLPAP
eukprot:6741317-Heterocapsa_arctica.AAC.1